MASYQTPDLGRQFILLCLRGQFQYDQKSPAGHCQKTQGFEVRPRTSFRVLTFGFFTKTIAAKLNMT